MATTSSSIAPPSSRTGRLRVLTVASGRLAGFFFFKQKTAYDIGLGIPAEPLFRSDADPKFFACLVRFESSSVPTTLPTAYDVYPLDGRHDGGYYTVKD